MSAEIPANDAPKQVGISFTRPQMLKKIVTHPRKVKDSDPSIFSVHVDYVMYGIDADGYRHYENIEREITIRDFITYATEKAQAGSMVALAALQGDEAAIVELIADDLGTTATIL